MPFAQIRDIRMYYEQRGSGPRLLYISGTGGDLRAGRVFEGPLAEAFDLLAYDQRGLGQTDKPDVPYTMADYAEDAAALLDHVGWDRARVIGVSFGGMVSQELAARYPERVERLVLACTSSGGAGGSSYPLHELEGLSPEEALKRRIGLYDARFGDTPREQWPASFAAIIDRAAQNRDLGADDPAKPTGAHRQLEARMGHDTYDRLHRLTMPVLVCGGRYDVIAPVKNLEALADRIPNARLQLYEGGHLFMWQDERAWPDAAAWLLAA